MPNILQKFTTAAKVATQIIRSKSTSFNDDALAILLGDNQSGVISSSYTSMARQGYMENEIVYFIVNDIAKSCAAIDIMFDQLPPEVARLLQRPEQGKPWQKWIFEQMCYRLIAGELYAQILRTGTRISELPIIRPDWITPSDSASNDSCQDIDGWTVTCGKIKTLSVDEVFFSRLMHPLQLWEGWSPLQAVRAKVQNSNEVTELNRNILANNGAPLGLLKFVGDKIGKAAQALNEDQLKKVKADFNSHFADKSQSIKVTNAGFDFQRIGMTGSEMDFSKVDDASIRRIAIAFGYPPELLGLSDGATFTNRAEAKEFLWVNTIIPNLKMVLCDLALLLGVPEIPLDLQNLPALAEIIRKQREAARNDFNAGIISLEEARAEGGYPEEINGTIFINPNKVPINTDFDGIDIENE